MNAKTALFSFASKVRRNWIDYNGHMGVSYYAAVFDQCAEAFYEEIGLGKSSAETGGGSLFLLEYHTTFLKELVEGTPISVTLQLLDWDEKRIHYFLRMTNDKTKVLAATSEQLAIHVDTVARSAAPLPVPVRHRISALWAEHQAYARPLEAGHIIRIRRKREPVD